MLTTCSNCYTGCNPIITDKCVKYTSVDVPFLGIRNGDSISYVEQVLIGAVVANAHGTGVQFTLPLAALCEAVSVHIPDCGNLSVVDITTALSTAICVMSNDVANLTSTLEGIESNYLPGCLDVEPDAGTHVLLQTAIAQVCENVSGIAAINLNLSTNYVNISDIDTYIQNYLDALNEEGGAGPGVNAAKMIPHTVVEYYGTLSNFDATGAGLGDWTNIYLCNGNNNTPDKRGRVAVGTTSGMGGGTLSAAVNPAVTGNPSYSLMDTAGANTVTLTLAQIPSHTHVATVSDPGHAHDNDVRTIWTNSVNNGGNGQQPQNSYTNYPTKTAVTGITVNNAAQGGGGSHANIQPVLACHYIMFIPPA